MDWFSLDEKFGIEYSSTLQIRKYTSFISPECKNRSIVVLALIQTENEHEKKLAYKTNKFSAHNSYVLNLD